MDLVPRIYHETQEADSQMCGQHALNNLLQNRYFQPTDLSEIAKQLDDEENETLDENREASQNMDDSGFFSVQVLDRCIQIWNLSLVRWRSEELADCWDKPEEQSAFILNLQSHWFCLRRFGQSNQRWYNLNSFLPTPQWISDTYLSMVIKSAEDEGYSVFVIRPSTAFSAPDVAGRESFLPNTSADEVAARLGPPNQTSASSSTSFRGLGQSLGGPSSGGGFAGEAAGGDFEDEDAALQRALQASLEDSSPGTPSQGPSARDVDPQDPVALSLARSQARLEAFQREQAAALRGDFSSMDDFLSSGAGVFGGQGGPTGYAAAVAGRSGSTSSSSRGGLGSHGSSRSGNVPLVDARTEAAAGGSRRARRQGDPSALSEDSEPSIPPSAPVRQRSRHDEDEEQMRRAIEASMREAKQRERAQAREARRTNAASGMDVEEEGEEDDEEEEEEEEEEPMDDDDEELETYSNSPSPPPGLQPAPVPARTTSAGRSDPFVDADLDGFERGDQGRSLLSGDRHLDDEDAELQRALAASMEGIPDGWHIPASPPPAPKPVARSPPPASVLPPAAPAGGPARSASASAPKSNDSDEDEDDDDEKPEKEEILSPVEIRRRRLARFG